mgnify:CR=1 FL=1
MQFAGGVYGNITFSATLKSVARFPQLLNIERPTYSNYELGKRTPTLELIVAFADFYNVTLDDLLINPDFTPSASKAENELAHSVGREQELLSIYRTLPDSEQKEFLEYARFKKYRFHL